MKTLSGVTKRIPTGALVTRRVRRQKRAAIIAPEKSPGLVGLPADDAFWTIYDGFIEEFRRQDREAVDSSPE